MKHRKTIHRCFLAITVLLLIFSFQNCSEPVQKSNDGFSEFAFNAKADTLGYMSCSEMSSADPSTYFTFRLGAYENGGVGLTEEFHRKTGQMSAKKKSEFLVNGDMNRDLQMQMSVRRISDMVPFSAGSQPREGEDFALIFPPINNSQLVSKLVEMQPGEKLNSLSGGLDSASRFEGSLTFSDSQVLEESVRTEILRGAVLAITYNPLTGGGTGGQDKTLAISPADFEENAAQSVSTAFGTGLKMKFRQGNIATGHPARVLSSVEEIDLTTKKAAEEDSESWVCPRNLQFKIVRPEDLGVSVNGVPKVECDRVLDPQFPSKDLERVRRVLRVEDWFVDMQNKCIIPKPGRVGSCYGDETEIEYNAEACGGAATCTHFASLCYRSR